MTKGKDDKSHAQAKLPADPREARLAQALRANLRRRKAAALPKDDEEA